MKRPAPQILSRVVAVCVPILVFLTLIAWAYSSAVGSSPDDDFHLASIWCGLGLREGLCEDSGDPATRLVPDALQDASCFAHRPEISGACWNPAVEGLDETSRVNTAPLYPPLFYAVMSVFAGPDVQTSVLLMRIANAALAVGLLTASYFALPRFLRPAVLVPTLVAVVPLGLFVAASTNPSSWALVSAAVVWVCLYGAFRTTGRQQITLCGLAVVGAVIGAGARADAAAFAVFGVVLAFILGFQGRRSLLYPTLTGAAIAVIAVAFYLSADQGLAVVDGLENNPPPLTTADHISNILGIPGLWTGALGMTALGSFDTHLPVLVPVFAFASFCAAAIIGVHRLERRRAVALGAAAVALGVVPFVLLAQSNLLVGYNLIQPRYILPLMIIMLGVASATPRARADWTVPRMIIIGGMSSAAAAVALHVNISRYTMGSDRPSVDPGSDAEWWWSGVPTPMIVWLVGSAAFALVFALLALLRSAQRKAESTAVASEALEV